MPKQDKVQRINQRRARPTDALGVSGGGAFVPPGTITLTTGNTTGATHTHELDIDTLGSLGLGHVLRVVEATGEVADYGVANETALAGALGSSVAGDVVLLPPGEIAGNHVVPAGVTLIGHGLNSVLSGTITGDGLLLNVQRSLDYPDSVLDTADRVWLGDQMIAGTLDVENTITAEHVLPQAAGTYDLGQDAWRWRKLWIDELSGAKVGGDLIPTLTDAYDLGSSVLHWRKLWVDELSGAQVGGDLIPALTGTYDLGSSVLHWRKLWIDELSGAKVGGDLIPTLTDAYDLGSSAKLWRRGYLSELRAVLFAEETIQLVGGWLIVPKDAGTFAADVAALDTTIDFGKTMTPGHWVLVRSYDAVTGNPAAEYITVGALVSGTRYNVTRNVDGSGANNWPAGTPFLVLGTEGDGRIELNAYDTPRIQIMQQGAAYNLNDEIVRIGDLNDSFGVTTERYGLGLGDYAAGNYLRYDPVDGFLLSAGNSHITIDASGIRLTAGLFESLIDSDYLRWEYGGNTVGRIHTQKDGAFGPGMLQIFTQGDDDHPQKVRLYSYNPTGAISIAYLDVAHGDGGDRGEIRTNCAITESTALGCRVYRSTTQSLSNATWTAMSYNTEIEDTGSCWSSAAATRLIAKRAGTYMVSASVSVARGTTSQKRYYMGIRKNGTNWEYQNMRDSNADAASVVCAISGQVVMAVDDYVEIMVMQDSGAAQNVAAATTTLLANNSAAFYRIP